MAQRLEGLAVIAAACDTSVDELVSWFCDDDFPLHHRKGKWWTTTADIDRWGQDRRRAERRRACRSRTT